VSEAGSEAGGETHCRFAGVLSVISAALLEVERASELSRRFWNAGGVVLGLPRFMRIAFEQALAGGFEKRSFAE
jgi:hypothetical protein